VCKADVRELFANVIASPSPPLPTNAEADSIQPRTHTDSGSDSCMVVPLQEPADLCHSLVHCPTWMAQPSSNHPPWSYRRPFWPDGATSSHFPIMLSSMAVSLPSSPLVNDPVVASTSLSSAVAPRVPNEVTSSSSPGVTLLLVSPDTVPLPAACVAPLVNQGGLAVLLERSLCELVGCLCAQW
jgi:hypothetical protein